MTYKFIGMENPLLQIQFPIPFDQIRAEHIEPAVDALLADAEQRVDGIGASGEPRTYENTLRALDFATEGLEYAVGIVRHLEGVASTPELRTAFNAVQPKVAAFYAGIPLRAELWRALKEFSATSEAQTLVGVRRRFLTKTLDSFRRHGADLDEAGKKTLAEIDVALAEATMKFGEHVVDATKDFEIVLPDESRLGGLPPSALGAARQSAASKNLEGYRLTLQGPSYVAAMTYLKDGALRKELYEAFNTRATRAPYDNQPLLGEILKLRKRKANLLGFKDFSDFVLADRMAGNGTRAIEFLYTLLERTETQFDFENSDLFAFRQKLEGEEALPIQPWDVAYYSEKQREALYNFDEEELRPYFPLERVVAGMFDIVERLFGIKVVYRAEVPGWHPDVRFYEIQEGHGRVVATFYSDWFPRETKRGGAWMDAFYTGDQKMAHVGTICGNLTPPIGDSPALLTHREVETIFHEFGHLLHHSLSSVEVRSLAGTNVAWDFVELPSQIMENWCWERDALDLFARHYQTGEAIPEELFEKMRRAKNFRAANAQMRQLGFGIVDLKLHRDYDPETDGDVLAYARRLLQRFAPAPLPENYAMIASFTHLFSSPVGYGAGYYSYKWAEVLDADAFTRFREQGIFSQEVGQAYRQSILAAGDSEDPAELYRRFMGRDPDATALLKRQGLLSHS